METHKNLVKLITDRCVENCIALPKIWLPVYEGTDLFYLEELAVKIITQQAVNEHSVSYAVNWLETLGFEDCEILNGYIDHAIERSM